eukprot:scaffold3869_cov111-Isochrysis_galbana.AAC.3
MPGLQGASRLQGCPNVGRPTASTRHPPWVVRLSRARKVIMMSSRVRGPPERLRALQAANCTFHVESVPAAQTDARSGERGGTA